MTTLKEYYKDNVIKGLREKFKYNNIMEVPKLTKIVINTGISTARERDFITETVKTYEAITGQRPVRCKAKRSVAGFKLREGQEIGTMVTLRNQMMYHFLTRLINNALPRVRDFRGVKTKSFDGFGNYSLGILDQSIFTEIDLDKIKYTIGMNICFVTTAKTDEEGRELLTLLGMPFAKEED